MKTKTQETLKFKRGFKDDTPAASRMVWESKCGNYRVVRSQRLGDRTIRFQALVRLPGECECWVFADRAGCLQTNMNTRIERRNQRSRRATSIGEANDAVQRRRAFGGGVDLLDERV